MTCTLRVFVRHRMQPYVKYVYSKTSGPHFPLMALLILYSTTGAFPCSTTNLPAPTNRPVSRSLNFSSPDSNLISMTRPYSHVSHNHIRTRRKARIGGALTHKTRQTPSIWHHQRPLKSSEAQARDPPHQYNSYIYARRSCLCTRTRPTRQHALRFHRF